MKTRTRLPFLLSTALIFLAAPGFAEDHAAHTATHKESQPAVGKLLPVTEKDAAWLAKARQNYPLEVCLVSDEKLGSMGESPEFIYRVDGQPDRLVKFCCDGCQEDFLKEPAKYLGALDAAAHKSANAKKTDGAKAADGQR